MRTLHKTWRFWRFKIELTRVVTLNFGIVWEEGEGLALWAGRYQLVVW